MRKERLNKKFLTEFQQSNFSRIKEEKIYLVGSARFKHYFLEIKSILQINYNKLVTICSFDWLLNKKKFSKEEWEKLQLIALKKLHYQDAVLVLDINGYFGGHTKGEIEHFNNNLKKKIYFLSELLKKLKKIEL
ncbi:MAG: hypothetical protein ACFFBH_08545 [Promethearchaeota archaeon]